MSCKILFKMLQIDSVIFQMICFVGIKKLSEIPVRGSIWFKNRQVV